MQKTIRIKVQFPQGSKLYTYLAPDDVKIGDWVEVRTQYSTSGTAAALVKSLGSEYLGRAAEVIRVMR